MASIWIYFREVHHTADAFLSVLPILIRTARPRQHAAKRHDRHWHLHTELGRGWRFFEMGSAYTRVRDFGRGVRWSITFFRCEGPQRPFDPAAQILVPGCSR